MEAPPRWALLHYSELAADLVPYVQGMGYTHVELMPISEHPLDESWGYQATGYFAPTSRFGSPDELRHLIDTFHQAGIGVILDWVPAHFPQDSWALARLTARLCMSMKIRAWVSIRIGARISLIMAATKLKPS